MFASSCLYRSQKKGFYWCCCLRALADLTAARCAQIFQIVSLSVATCWQVKEQLELWEEVRRYRIHFMELWFTTELHRVITQCDNTAVSSWSHPEVQIVFTFLIFLLLLLFACLQKCNNNKLLQLLKVQREAVSLRMNRFLQCFFPLMSWKTDYDACSYISWYPDTHYIYIYTHIFVLIPFIL